MAVYRPSDGGWYIRYSSLGYALNQWAYFQWGLSTDIPLAADFDGDGRSDLVVYRPSDGGWYIRYSALGYAQNQWGYFQWGLSTDIPIPADFDGDGRTDLAIYRPSDGGWYIRYSSLGWALNQWAYFQWGLPADTPLTADFDGDGRTDLAVYRPSDGGWYVRYSSLGYALNQWAILPVGSLHRQAAGRRLRRRRADRPRRLSSLGWRLVHPLLVLSERDRRWPLLDSSPLRPGSSQACRIVLLRWAGIGFESAQLTSPPFLCTPVPRRRRAQRRRVSASAKRLFRRDCSARSRSAPLRPVSHTVMPAAKRGRTQLLEAHENRCWKIEHARPS